MKTLLLLSLVAASAAEMNASDFQGVIADWHCVQPMVRNGREKTLRDKRSCSLMKNYHRKAYGLITDQKKYYRLEDPGNRKVLQILKDSPDKDNIHVVITGDVEGDTLKISNISLL